MGLSFAAERMLGRLAKWLRILGFDTIYELEALDGHFSRLEPERIVLTRRRLPDEKAPAGNPTIVVYSDQYWDQLLEVVRKAGVSTADLLPLSRCVRCNSTLIPLDRSAVQGSVPDYVRETHQVFKTCPGCRRIYWSGSHIERCLERIQQLFDGSALTN